MPSLEDLRKAEETVKFDLPLRVDQNQLIAPNQLARASAHAGSKEHTAAWAEYLCLAANALPKLLALVEAAEEVAETGCNILGLKEALRALNEESPDAQ